MTAAPAGGGLDVLAVLDLHIAAMAAGRERVPCKAMAFYDESRESFIAARAAVAELIEAATDVAGDLTRNPEPGTPLARLDAALAKVASNGDTK